MNKLAALVLLALVAQSYAAHSYSTRSHATHSYAAEPLVFIDQEGVRHHSRKLQQFNLLNAFFGVVNAIIAGVSLGTVVPDSGIYADNRTLSGNLNLRITNAFNPSDTTTIKSSTGISGNTIYSYTNATTQIKDGLYGALFGGSYKIINSSLGGAIGGGVNGSQITGSLTQQDFNKSGVLTNFQSFQGSFQLQPNVSLFGYNITNTARNISQSAGTVVNPFVGTTGIKINSTVPTFGR